MTSRGKIKTGAQGPVRHKSQDKQIKTLSPWDNIKYDAAKPYLKTSACPNQIASFSTNSRGHLSHVPDTLGKMPGPQHLLLPLPTLLRAGHLRHCTHGPPWFWSKPLALRSTCTLLRYSHRYRCNMSPRIQTLRGRANPPRQGAAIVKQSTPCR